MWKSKRLLRVIALLSTSVPAGLIALAATGGLLWTTFDFQLLDFYYRHAVAAGHGPAASKRIVYLNITDDTYRAFGSSTLNRASLASANDALEELGAAAIAYDIIFARPDSPENDSIFAASIAAAGNVFLPSGFGLEDGDAGDGTLAPDFFYAAYPSMLKEDGRGRPFQARRASLQWQNFAQHAHGGGHISAASDADGVYRHVAMLIKVDSVYVPTLTLAIFLAEMRVPLAAVEVEWGETLRIPALAGSLLMQDVVIPIDQRGRAFVPFVQTWDRDFKQMTVHSLLQHFQDDELRGNLEEFFSDSFVFIGEAAIGISDLGATPLESDVPLVAIHASMMNALLHNQFYRRWGSWPTAACIAGIALIFGLAACFRPNSVLYACGIAALAGLLLMPWQQMQHFSLVPASSLLAAAAVQFFGLVAGLQIAVAKDQAFIRSAFAKYVPERVVQELLSHPEQLQLGGEERELTVLFADLEGFTSLAEQLPPATMVRLLNDYFSEMTELIFAEGGIIDKYLGDGIMAEFGAPLPLAAHADHAVLAALQMQRRLADWRQRDNAAGISALRCRIGINTGRMVIGNMGSYKAFDYTVIGDAVNLASRLEGANKFYGTSLLISEHTWRELTPGRFHTRLLDVVKVKGKREAIRVFEVYGEAHEPIQAGRAAYYRRYQHGVRAYLQRDFAAARQAFQRALESQPDDLAATTLLRRIDTLDAETLAPDWDGAIVLAEK